MEDEFTERWGQRHYQKGGWTTTTVRLEDKKDLEFDSHGRYVQGGAKLSLKHTNGAEDQSVTIRDRDSMEQERIKISELRNYFLDKFTF